MSSENLDEDLSDFITNSSTDNQIDSDNTEFEVDYRNWDPDVVEKSSLPDFEFDLDPPGDDV